MRRVVLSSVLALSAALSVTGCKTTTTAMFGDTYHTIEGRYIDAPAVRAAATRPAEPAPSGHGIPMGLSALAVESEEIPMDAPELEGYLRSIAERLLAGWDGPRPAFRIRITTSQAYNAYALPDHDIFIHRGVLENAESEDEVAALLAHELGHILLHHFERGRVKEAHNEIADLAVLGATVVAGFAEHAESESARTAGQVIRAALLAKLVANDVLDPGWAREQEDQADLLAVDLLLRAGYSRKGALDMFQRLKAAHIQQKKNMDVVEETYRARLDAYMQAGQFDEGFAAMTEMLQQAALATVGDVMTALARRHAAPEDRYRNVRGYLNREYRRAPIRKVTVGRLAALRQNDALQRAQRANDALFLVSRGDIREGERLAREALRNDRDANPPARLALYMAEKKRGKRTAKAHLERAVGHPNAPARLYQMLAAEYAQEGRHAQATAVLEEGERKLGREEAFVLLKADVLTKAGRSAEARELLTGCTATYGNEIGRRCQASLEGMGV